MVEKTEYVGIRMPVSLRGKIEQLAADEYANNESMAIKVILQKFFVKNDKQSTPGLRLSLDKGKKKAGKAGEEKTEEGKA